VQATLEAALANAFGHAVRTTVAGRTDAGVHADAQVVSFSTTSTMPAHGLAEVLPRYLPGDVWLIDVVDAPAGFDARRSAKRRWYRYAVWRGEAPPTAWQGRCVAHPHPLDVAAMRAAAKQVLGHHDFRGVASPPANARTHRTVFAADWLDLGQLLTFEICADSFLTHMVRGIVGGLLLVGRGRWTAEQFASALHTKDRREAGPNAPSTGLTLSRIEY
jgi:tRNA pseudouridine38-40 synthase